MGRPLEWGIESPVMSELLTSPVEVQDPKRRADLSRQSLQSRILLGLVAVAVVLTIFWPRTLVREAPGGFLFDPEGRPATLGERLAPVTLLHFWATWCPPCLTEIPSLTRLGAEVGGEDFGILMVAVDDDTSKVASFLGQQAATTLYDPNWEVAHRYGTFKLPETYLLVGNKVVDKLIGAQDWDSPALRKRLAEQVQKAGREPLQFVSSQPGGPF